MIETIKSSTEGLRLLRPHTIEISYPYEWMTDVWESKVFSSFKDAAVKQLVTNAKTAIRIYGKYGKICELRYGTIETDITDYFLAASLVQDQTIDRSVIAPTKLWSMLFIINGTSRSLKTVREKRLTFIMPKGQLKVQIFDLERLDKKIEGKWWKCSCRGEMYLHKNHISNSSCYLFAGEKVFYPCT